MCSNAKQSDYPTRELQLKKKKNNLTCKLDTCIFIVIQIDHRLSSNTDQNGSWSGTVLMLEAKMQWHNGDSWYDKVICLTYILMKSHLLWSYTVKWKWSKFCWAYVRIPWIQHTRVNIWMWKIETKLTRQWLVSKVTLYFANCLYFCSLELSDLSSALVTEVHILKQSNSLCIYRSLSGLWPLLL